MFAIEPNPNINPDFWVNDMRNHVLYGGRASSKSWEAAWWAVILSMSFRVNFICVRQLQNRIEESVYTLLVTHIYNMGFKKKFKITNNKIVCKKTGSSFVFYGLWRHIDEIKGSENKDICWIEEAHALTEKQWEILEPTVRKNDSKFWIVFNPGTSADFSWQRFVVNPPPRTITRKINYDENPHVSRTLLDVIEAKKSEDYAEYEHIYLGVPRDDDESVIIKRTWLNAAVDAHIKLGIETTGSHRIGFDIADDGGDRCVNVMAYGCLAYHMDWWKASEDELLKSCKRTYSNARQHQARIIYDSIGVGASAGSKFAEINAEPGNTFHCEYQKFRAGDAVINPERVYAEGVRNKDMFCNLKAQAWWSVADRLRNTWDAVTNGTHYDPSELICISSAIPDLERLLTELATPKKDYDNTDKIKVESKKDMEKREVKSPDLADAFIMAFAPVDSARGVLDVLMARKAG